MEHRIASHDGFGLASALVLEPRSALFGLESRRWDDLVEINFLGGNCVPVPVRVQLA